MAEVLVCLANGFEEIEAVTIIDVLRRANFNVTIAALSELDVHGNHGIIIKADTVIENIQEDQFDALIFPGGEPGVTNLQANPIISKLMAEFIQTDRIIGAICAAPRLLDSQGYLSGKNITAHPSVKDKIKSTIISNERVVKDGNIITGQSASASLEFSYGLVEALSNSNRVKLLKEAMLF